MYRTKEMNGTDHSAILSTRVTIHCTVHSITYRYTWISYLVYSKYNTASSRKDAVLNVTYLGRLR
jgi:hypothetical protein